MFKSEKAKVAEKVKKENKKSEEKKAEKSISNCNTLVDIYSDAHSPITSKRILIQFLSKWNLCVAYRVENVRNEHVNRLWKSLKCRNSEESTVDGIREKYESIWKSSTTCSTKVQRRCFRFSFYNNSLSNKSSNDIVILIICNDIISVYMMMSSLLWKINAKKM